MLTNKEKQVLQILLWVEIDKIKERINIYQKPPVPAYIKGYKEDLEALESVHEKIFCLDKEVSR
jgi:hypothetical protein